MLQGLRRWLRTGPAVRWSWPRTVFRPAERRSGAAHLVALRFTTETADEVQIRNHGPGDASDIVLTCLQRSPEREEQSTAASLAYLGAGSSYIVSLRPGGAHLQGDPIPATDPGRWLRLQWRSPYAGGGETWAGAEWNAPLTDPLTELVHAHN